LIDRPGLFLGAASERLAAEFCNEGLEVRDFDVLRLVSALRAVIAR
jgi:hypothetical protein